MTLNEIWEKYYSLVLASKERNTKITAKGRYEKYLQPYYGNCQLEEISTPMVYELKNILSQTHLSAQSVASCLSLLKRLFLRAKDWDYYSGKIPVFEMPKFDNKRTKFLTKEEAELLFPILYEVSPIWHDMALLALNTGMRLGEIRKLTREHVHLDKGFINVVDTKTSKNRQIPLSQKAMEILPKYLVNCKSLFSKVFVNKRGVVPANSKVFRDAVKLTGINAHIADRRQKFVFHSLRHTFASWLVSDSISLEIIGELLGHSDVKVTMRYAHLTLKDTSKAVKVIDRMLS